MARRNGNEIQDRLINQMERINRNSNTDKIKTLKEQLDEFNLSPEEKQKRKSVADWHIGLKDLVYKDKEINIKVYTWATFRYKNEIENYRTSGASYKTVLSFIRSKIIEYMNL
jgi:hypothetical protein